MAIAEGNAPRNLPGSDAPARISTWQQVALNLFWFANNFHWQALLSVILPSEVGRFLGESSAQEAANYPKVVVAGTAIAIVVNPLTGAISDYVRFRLGRRRPFMLIGTVPNVLALIGLAFAAQIGEALGRMLHVGTDGATLATMAALFLVLQFSNNVANAPWSAIIADKVPASQRGSASGYYGLMTLLGIVAGSVVAGALVNGNEPNLAVYKNELLIAYGAIAVVQVLFVTITVLTVHERALTQRRPFRWAVLTRLFWVNPRRYPDFVWLLFTRLLMLTGIWAINSFLLFYFQHVLGGELARLGIKPEAGVGIYFLPVVVITSVLTTLIAGKLSDRTGRKRLVYLAGAVMSIVCVIFIFFQSFSGALVAAAFFGLGYGAYTSVDWALATDVLPPTDEYGKDMGIWTAAGIVPQVLGIVLGGAILSALNFLPNNAGYSVLFAVVVVFFVAGTVFVSRVKGAR
jgi:MFS family permease